MASPEATAARTDDDFDWTWEPQHHCRKCGYIGIRAEHKDCGYAASATGVLIPVGRQKSHDGAETPCGSSVTYRDDEHREYECERPKGHLGVHESGDASWTGPDCKWDESGVDDSSAATPSTGYTPDPMLGQAIADADRLRDAPDETSAALWFLTWHPKGNPKPYPSGSLNGSVSSKPTLLEAVQDFEDRGMTVVEARRLGVPEAGAVTAWGFMLHRWPDDGRWELSSDGEHVHTGTLYDVFRALAEYVGADDPIAPLEEHIDSLRGSLARASADAARLKHAPVDVGDAVPPAIGATKTVTWDGERWT